MLNGRQKWVKMLKIAFFILFMLIPFTLLNYGKWLDATEKPVKSDIIVCLGGGTYQRLIRSKELLDAGYAEKNLILLVGEANYNERYVEKHYPDLPTIVDERPKNTAQEIRFVKEFLKEHNYKSALIVTDPPHSRRASLLASLILVGDDRTLHLHFVDSGVRWWNREQYWKNKKSWGFVKAETLRIIYTLLFSANFRYSKTLTDYR